MLVGHDPFLLLQQPDVGVRRWRCHRCFCAGISAQPPGSRLRLFAEASGGIIYTTEPVPVRTTTFNFMDQAGFGVRFEESQARLAGGIPISAHFERWARETESRCEFQFRLRRPEFSPIGSISVRICLLADAVSGTTNVGCPALLRGCPVSQAVPGPGRLQSPVATRL